MSEITFAVLDRLREGRTDTEQEAIGEAVGTINSAEQAITEKLAKIETETRGYRARLANGFRLAPAIGPSDGYVARLGAELDASVALHDQAYRYLAAIVGGEVTTDLATEKLANHLHKVHHIHTVQHGRNLVKLAELHAEAATPGSDTERSQPAASCKEFFNG